MLSSKMQRCGQPAPPRTFARAPLLLEPWSPTLANVRYVSVGIPPVSRTVDAGSPRARQGTP